MKECTASAHTSRTLNTWQPARQPASQTGRQAGGRGRQAIKRHAAAVVAAAVAVVAAVAAAAAEAAAAVVVAAVVEHNRGEHTSFKKKREGRKRKIEQTENGNYSNTVNTNNYYNRNMQCHRHHRQ